MAAMELSLRRYVTLILVLMIAAIIGTFSYLSAKQFLAGMDGMLRGTMVDAARRTDISPGTTLEVLSYTITTDWHDLPPEVKNTFDPQQLVPFELYKDVTRKSIFHRPEEAKFVLLAEFDGRPAVYVAQHFKPREHKNKPPLHISREAWVMILGIATMLIFSGLLLLMIKAVARPVEALSKWAAGMKDADNIEPPPHFRYAELNALAGLVYQGMRSVKQSVQREQDFVRHASHELRTPIAVIRSSMELIKRVRSGVDPDKLSRPLQRIDNASHTMADLTETLLWLAKTERENLSQSAIALDTMLEHLTEELKYLTQGKAVTVTIDTQAHTLHDNQTAVRIVAGNLIRNAFQHTLEGEIKIVQRAAEVKIINTDSDSDNKSSDSMALGFGLGLQMVEQLSEAMGWRYCVDKQNRQLYSVEVDFNRH